MSELIPVSQVKAVGKIGRETVGKYAMRFGASKRLADFTDRYRFFTPAIMYLYGRFFEQPWANFAEEHQKEFHLLHYKFTKPVFRGLEAPNHDTAWNYVLWAVEQDAWTSLEQFILSLAFTDAAAGVVYRFGGQDVAITDPLAADHHNLNSGTVPIVCFGVSCDKYCAHLDVCNPLFLPRCVLSRPEKRAELFSEAMAGGGVQNAVDTLLPKSVTPVRGVALTPVHDPTREGVMAAIAAYRVAFKKR